MARGAQPGGTGRLMSDTSAEARGRSLRPRAGLMLLSRVYVAENTVDPLESDTDVI